MTIVQEKTTRVGGMTIFYREAGAGEPILLLHGVPTSSYLWRRTHLSVGTRPRLAAFGRAVAPDHYGFGKSDKPADRDLKGSALAILDDAGHFVQEDQPEKVAQLIEAFYARRPWDT